jgi:hypothetical protein
MSVTNDPRPPDEPPFIPCAFYHENPAVIVEARPEGGARLHAYLSGFDECTADTGAARVLALALLAACDRVDALNGGRLGG